MYEAYRSQVDLLLKVLPYVAKEKSFALKGGTAINLFVRNMPRLSVDIDLAYLPFDSRPLALSKIEASLQRIKKDIEDSKQGIRVKPISKIDQSEVTFSCEKEGVIIKIEVNTVILGCLLEPKILSVAEKVQDEFGLFAEIIVISKGELFGGKICAALDRQHPRDLFDVHYLLENEGITNEIKSGLIACILSHRRPIHELLNPNLQDQRMTFEQKFLGMAFEKFDYEDFLTTRKRLLEEVKKSLSDQDKRFLLSFNKGEPEWSLFEIEIIKKMPGVMWKLQNINILANKNKTKHIIMIKALEEELEII